MRLFRTEEAASRIAVFVLGQNVAIQDLSRIFKTDGIPQVVSRQALVLRCRVRLPQAILIPVSYTHLDVYKRQEYAYALFV